MGLSVFTAFIERHPYAFSILSFILVVVIAVLAIVILRSRRLRVPAGYLLVFIAAAAIASMTNMLYFWAFALGSLMAFGEIIGKFRDDPIKAFVTTQALVYHGVNGVMSCAALYILRLYDIQMDAAPDQVRAVVGAGLGAGVVMRSKFFNIRVGDEEVALGPDQLVKVFFRVMEKSIDRVRAEARVDFVESKMENISYSKARSYCVTMLNASVTMDNEARRKLIEDIAKVGDAPLSDDRDSDEQLKAYLMAFIVLDEMGEDFLEKLVTNGRGRWAIRAPLQNSPPGPLAGVPLVGQTYVNYFAYGPNLGTAEMARRLNLTRENRAKFGDVTKPTKADLIDYRLTFGRPTGRPGEGTAALEYRPGSKVEGVIYALLPDALKFLERYETNYCLAKVVVTRGSTKVECDTYMTDVIDSSLHPSTAHRQLIVSGARERQLSSEYIATLESIPAVEDVQGEERRSEGDGARSRGAPAAGEVPVD